MHPALRLRWNNSNRAADGVLGCCLRGDYHHYGSGLETASTSDALGSASSVAHCVELCRQLSVCCHNLRSRFAMRTKRHCELGWWPGQRETRADKPSSLI